MPALRAGRPATGNSTATWPVPPAPLPTVSPVMAEYLSMLPPTVLVTAEFDEVVAGGEQLAEALRRNVSRSCC